jgi:hypothetical protein
VPLRTRRLALRSPALALAVPLLAGALAGCGHLAANLSQRELVVQFKSGTTAAQHREVRTACSGYPGTRPEPLPTSKLASVRANDVRFRVDKASDAQLAHLEACLTRFPFVLGVSDTDTEMH